MIKLDSDEPCNAGHDLVSRDAHLRQSARSGRGGDSYRDKKRAGFRSCRSYALFCAAALTGLSLLASGLTGCTNKNEQQYENRASSYGTREVLPNGSPQDLQLYGQQSRAGSNHENNHLVYDADLSYKVAGIPGVLTSVVMATDSNAYVAIVLDGSGTGTMARGGRLEGSNVGNTRGMYNSEKGTQYMDPNKIWTDSNSYFTVSNERDLSSKFKQHIAAQVRRSRPDILEVYISANRDVVNQMSVYAKAARNGEQMDRYLPQFNNFVKENFAVKP